MLQRNFAIVRTATGKAELRAVPLPSLPDDYILVRTVAVALNPTDWTTLDAKGDDGSTIGVDYAGVVEKVGPGVSRNFAKGDRIAGISHGGSCIREEHVNASNDANPQTGAFARYIIVKGDIQQHIPDGVSFEAACTVGVAVVTAGYALYNRLGIPLPTKDVRPLGRDVLICGGSSATGTLAIQFAKLSGMRVLTTASPKNFDLLRQRGANKFYDYRDPDHGKKIREDTNSSLEFVFDCVSTEDTAAASAEAIGTKGGRYVNLLDSKCPREDVESIFFLGYSASGESYIFEGEHYDADLEYLIHATDFAKLVDMIWKERKFVPHPQRLEQGGLNGIVESGLQIMRDGKYSAEKLVYRVEETKWP